MWQQVMTQPYNWTNAKKITSCGDTLSRFHPSSITKYDTILRWPPLNIPGRVISIPNKGLHLWGAPMPGATAKGFGPWDEYEHSFLFFFPTTPWNSPHRGHFHFSHARCPRRDPWPKRVTLYWSCLQCCPISPATHTTAKEGKVTKGPRIIVHHHHLLALPFVA